MAVCLRRVYVGVVVQGRYSVVVWVLLEWAQAGCLAGGPRKIPMVFFGYTIICACVSALVSCWYGIWFCRSFAANVSIAHNCSDHVGGGSQCQLHVGVFHCPHGQRQL